MHPPGHATIELDWEAVWEAEKDICYLYHWLAEFSAIDGDLPYGSVFKQPCWELIGAVIPEMRRSQALFLRKGGLMFVLAMAWDVIQGSGSYLRDHYDRCASLLREFRETDPATLKLAEIVRLSLEVVRDRTRLDELETGSCWANKNFVRAYFREHSVRPPFGPVPGTAMP